MNWRLIATSLLIRKYFTYSWSTFSSPQQLGNFFRWKQFFLGHFVWWFNVRFICNHTKWRLSILVYIILYTYKYIHINVYMSIYMNLFHFSQVLSLHVFVKLVIITIRNFSWCKMVWVLVGQWFLINIMNACDWRQHVRKVVKRRHKVVKRRWLQ